MGWLSRMFRKKNKNANYLWMHELGYKSLINISFNKIKDTDTIVFSIEDWVSAFKEGKNSQFHFEGGKLFFVTPQKTIPVVAMTRALEFTYLLETQYTKEKLEKLCSKKPLGLVS